MRTGLRSALGAVLLVLLVATASCSDKDKSDATSSTSSTTATTAKGGQKSQDPAVVAYCQRAKANSARASLADLTRAKATYLLVVDTNKNAPAAVTAASATLQKFVENLATSPNEDEYRRRLASPGADLAPAYITLLGYQLQNC